MRTGKDSHDEDVFYYGYLKLNNEEEILRITVDRKLTFDKHIKNICRKAGQKLSDLLKLSLFFDTNKRRITHTSMVKSHSLINKVQEKVSDNLKWPINPF